MAKKTWSREAKKFRNLEPEPAPTPKPVPAPKKKAPVAPAPPPVVVAPPPPVVEVKPVPPPAPKPPKVKRARFVREKQEPRTPVQGPQLPPRSQKFVGKFMTKNLAVPPKELPPSAPKRPLG